VSSKGSLASAPDSFANSKSPNEEKKKERRQNRLEDERVHKLPSIRQRGENGNEGKTGTSEIERQRGHCTSWERILKRRIKTFVFHRQGGFVLGKGRKSEGRRGGD